MTPDEIEHALWTAFEQCEEADMRLTNQQKQILREALGVYGNRDANPLNQLTLDERHALLDFIQAQEEQNLSWKMSLLNDWLNGLDSGTVQFIRDRYGVQWLERVKTFHLADFAEPEDGVAFQLKVGDRIEVSNGLWEWVQESGSCSREWFPCVVISVRQAVATEDGLNRHASCVVRFDSGAEYEIQGIYEWNRPNWRWVE